MKLWMMFAAAALLSGEPAGREMGVANVWMKSGLHVKVTARIGSGASMDYGFGVRTTDRNLVYREFSDGKRVVFGYEIEVTQLAEKDRVQVVVKPLGPEYLRLTNRSNVATFPDERTLPVMWLGDRATIDVLENPSTGAKVTDTIEVDRAGMAESEPAPKSGIGFFNARLLINGQPAGSSGTSGVRGDEIVMFYVPGRGSYFLSQTPVPGYSFLKIVTVAGKRLNFALNNEAFELQSDTDISPSTELWVFHDPRKPTARWLKRDDDKFFHAAAGNMQSFYAPQ